MIMCPVNAFCTERSTVCFVVEKSPSVVNLREIVQQAAIQIFW